MGNKMVIDKIKKRGKKDIRRPENKSDIPKKFL